MNTKQIISFSPEVPNVVIYTEDETCEKYMENYCKWLEEKVTVHHRYNTENSGTYFEFEPDVFMKRCILESMLITAPIFDKNEFIYGIRKDDELLEAVSVGEFIKRVAAFTADKLPHVVTEDKVPVVTKGIRRYANADIVELTVDGTIYVYRESDIPRHMYYPTYPDFKRLDDDANMYLYCRDTTDDYIHLYFTVYSSNYILGTYELDTDCLGIEFDEFRDSPEVDIKVEQLNNSMFVIKSKHHEHLLDVLQKLYEIYDFEERNNTYILSGYRKNYTGLVRFKSTNITELKEFLTETIDFSM